MRKKNLLLAFSIITNFILVSSSYWFSSSRVSEKISSYGAIGFSGVGVNYLSLHHMYHTADDILRRDFSRFQLNGINVISLSLYWYRLEGHVRGSYDGIHPNGGPYGKRFLDNCKRVIAIALEYEIKVLVTIHTLWGDDSVWCTPNYVVDPVTGQNIGLAVVRSEDMKQAFVDMFNHTVRYLAGTPGIWAWAIINEPWYWPHELPAPHENVDQKENFIGLIQELAGIVKTLDPHPVTVRFCNTHTWIGADEIAKIKNIFVDDWAWDQRMFDALDFIGFCAYVPKYPELYDAWCNMTEVNVIGSFHRSKHVWITEFGYSSDDDFVQADYYRRQTLVFGALPIEAQIAWMWQSDSSSMRLGLPGKSFNICADATTGEVRPAYHELIAQ